MTQEWLTPAVLAEFSADGRRLATVADDRKLIKLWDAEDGRLLATLRGLRFGAIYVAISRDGGRVAATTFDRSQVNPDHRDVNVWDAATGRVLASFGPAPAPDALRPGPRRARPRRDADRLRRLRGRRAIDPVARVSLGLSAGGQDPRGAGGPGAAPAADAGRHSLV